MNKQEQLKELLEEKENLLASDEACRKRGIKEYSKECHEIREKIKLMSMSDEEILGDEPVCFG